MIWKWTIPPVGESDRPLRAMPLLPDTDLPTLAPGNTFPPDRFVLAGSQRKWPPGLIDKDDHT